MNRYWKEFAVGLYSCLSCHIERCYNLHQIFHNVRCVHFVLLLSMYCVLTSSVVALYFFMHSLCFSVSEEHFMSLSCLCLSVCLSVVRVFQPIYCDVCRYLRMAGRIFMKFVVDFMSSETDAQNREVGRRTRTPLPMILCACVMTYGPW
jgi:accessory gene regulator protein AgrB